MARVFFLVAPCCSRPVSLVHGILCCPPQGVQSCFFGLHPFGLMELVFFCCCCPAGAFWTRCSMPGEPITQKTLWTPGVDSKNNSRNRARGKRGNNNTNKKDRPGGGWVCFFVRAPPRCSLTHCAPGPRRFPGRAGCFLFGSAPAEPGEPTKKNVWSVLHRV